MKNEQKATLSADYTVTNAFATVGNLSFKCLKTGHYRINSYCTVYCASGAAKGAYIRLALDGNKIGGTTGLNYNGNTVDTYRTDSKSIDNIYIKKGVEVSLQAKYLDAACVVETATDIEAYLQIQEMGE